jgi:hypothetical protein
VTKKECAKARAPGLGALARQKICEEGGVGLARSERWRRRHEGRKGGRVGDSTREEGTKANGTTGGDGTYCKEGTCPRYRLHAMCCSQASQSGLF